VRLAGLLSSLVLSASCAAADARSWSALYVFGDSYSDSGAGYVDGNGPTAVACLAARLGIPFTYAGDPQESGKSLNFAVSGARTGKGEGVKMRLAGTPCCSGEILIRRGMKDQVADFSRRVASGSLRFDPGTTLFFLAGGLNDHNIATETSVANLESEIRALHEAGGRYFWVALLPRKIPEFASVGAPRSRARSDT
jgi:phospholipase/lecithinase/hemolysin